MNAQTNHGRLTDDARVGHLLANAAQNSRTRISCADRRLNGYEPTEISQPSTISRTVSLLLLRTIVLTLAIISSFLDVDGRPERGSLSSEILPTLHRRNQSNTCVRPTASSPYACCNNWYVCVEVFPILKQKTWCKCVVLYFHTT